ncbi:MAG: hypothetical protein AB7O62_22645, partial [Pirellulales bacterium]
HEHPFIVNLWTHAVVAFELAFGLLIWNRLWRPMLLGLSLLMWCSLALVTGLVPFCFLMILAGVAYVPGEVLGGWFSRRDASNANTAAPSAEEKRRVRVAR